MGVIFRLQSSVSPLDPTEFQLKTLNKSKDLSIVDVPSNSLSLILKSMGDIYFSILAIILLLSSISVAIALIIKVGFQRTRFFQAGEDRVKGQEIQAV